MTLFAALREHADRCRVCRAAFVVPLSRLCDEAHAILLSAVEAVEEDKSMSMSMLERVNPHLATIRAAARAISSAGHGRSGGEIERARFALFNALESGDDDTARAWLNTLETAVLAGREAVADHPILSGLGVKLRVAIEGLRGIMDEDGRP